MHVCGLESNLVCTDAQMHNILHNAHRAHTNRACNKLVSVIVSTTRLTETARKTNQRCVWHEAARRLFGAEHGLSPSLVAQTSR
jgi:hypothetical protein